MNETKQKLIQIAIETIQKSGINGLTIRELGNAVGIKSSSVLYHFKNKDALMFELVTVYNENFFLYLNEIEKEYSNPIDRLDKLVSVFEEVLNEDKLCFCGMLASEADILDINTKEQTKNFFIEVEKWIEKNIIELSLDKNLSKVIISSLEGAMLIDKLYNKAERLKSIRTWIQTLQ